MQKFNRSICTNNRMYIVITQGALFFSSKRSSVWCHP